MDLDQIEDDLIDDAIFQAVIEAVQTQMVDKPPKESRLKCVHLAFTWHLYSVFNQLT